MIEVTKEICKHCGREYEDTHVWPRAPYAPFLCNECEEELNRICGGSWVAAVYQSIKDGNPFERAVG